MARRIDNRSIKLLRTQRQETQGAFAERVQIRQARVCQIEGGEMPSIKTAARIALAHGCTIEDIWDLHVLADVPANWKGGEVKPAKGRSK